MTDAGAILNDFYAAVIKRNLAADRKHLAENLVFVGLFETYRSPDEYLAALTGLLQFTVRLDVKKIIAQGGDDSGRRVAPDQKRKDIPRRVSL